MGTKRTRTPAQDVQSGNVKQVEETEIVYTPGVEIKMMTAVIFLLAFGLIMIFSASSFTCSISASCNYDSAYYFKRQLMFIVPSLGVLAVVNLIPYKLFKKFAWLLYAVSIGFILLLKTPLARSSHGATRWLYIFGIQIQVADITKVCMIIFMAYYISKYWKVIHKTKTIVVLWVLMTIQAAMILFISSNLSSALILMIMCFILTWIVSRNMVPHAIVMALGIMGFILLIIWLKKEMPYPSELENYPYQIQRFFGWLDPERYASSVGYQPLQSLYAIGSGGLLGKGLGNGTQKLANIPEAQNDMIFSIICEELGLVGVIILFMMYGYLLYQMYVIVKESRNLYGSVVVIGVMLHIITQIIVNVCVAVNLFPNTGVSLPFISYGGTALLFTLIEIGLVIGIRRQQVRRRYSRIK